VRKRIAIAGHSDKGLSLIPLLEANPNVEVAWILTDDRDGTLAGLARVKEEFPRQYESRITADAAEVLRTPGLTAVIEAEPSDAIKTMLEEAAGHGVQRTTPLVAKLLFAFGPVEGFRKPDLLNTLGEILESYNLTIDRRGLLERILQIAVGSTGAERGSLMLYDPEAGKLRVEVAIGIERELIPKIRVAPGEGIAGRAFEERTPLLITGKADWGTYQITRERDDVESALSVPLIHGDQVLGVLNLSHTRERGKFARDDLEFVEHLAQLDARIIARAEEYHSLQRDSVRLRAESEVRRRLSRPGPLRDRLEQVCSFLAEEVCHGIAHLYLRDPELDVLVLQASSLGIDPLASSLKLRPSEGAIGWSVRSGRCVLLAEHVDGVLASYAVVPLGDPEAPLGVLTVEGADSRADANDLVREVLEAAAATLGGELRDLLRGLRIEREATRMGAITEAAARMSTCKDSAELARTITSTAAMILESEHAVLRLREEASGRFQIRSYFGSAETDTQGNLLALEKELAIAAIRQRSSLRIPRLEARADLDARGVGVNCAILQPLIFDGRILGTLSVMNNVGRDPLIGERFGREDERTLVRLCEHAANALGSMLSWERSRHRVRFDDVTGLPNLTHLRERADEELARASARGRTVALLQLRIVGLEEILRNVEPDAGDRLVLSLAQEFRAALREFDIPIRAAPDIFAALVPEPDGDIGELLGPMARRIREALAREPEVAGPEPLPLEFGYACFPEDGSTARGLEERARTTRIRTV
jgi:GAF domain-containing protein